MVTTPLEWSPGHTYVIGHQRPDTDSIAAAIGYAWLLAEIGDDTVRAARCGPPGDQARYALERFEMLPPPLVNAVAPTFGHVVEPRPGVGPDAPLEEALSLLAEGNQVIVPVLSDDRRPLGVVGPLPLARAFARRQLGRQSGVRGCGELAEERPVFRWRDRISDQRNVILRADGNQFVVTDEAGRYVGLVSQRNLLSPPRARLILVDHNELSQAVAGADEAEIVGVLDHHRLGNPPTAAAIPFRVEPVGSTSTLVAEACRASRAKPPRGVAGLLLSGILSDTLAFRSPTCTGRDTDLAEWLSTLLQIDPHLYGKELLFAAPGLAARTPDEILDTDRKAYIMAGVLVSIAQAEVTGMQEVAERRDLLCDGLSLRRVREGLALACLMITDVVTGTSRLLVQGERPFVDALPFQRVSDSEFDLGDIVSRKKQLAPAIQGALETA